MTLLSVLIPTVSVRESLLSRLLWGITQQPGDYEVLVHRGDRVPSGDKRTRMMSEARGEYLVHVDDDDTLALDYMQQVLPHLAWRSLDWLGYRILVLEEGRYWLEVEHRPGLLDWGEKVRGFGPKCPVRSELAQAVAFGNEYTDDQVWSLAVARMLRSADYIDRALYVYEFSHARMLGTAPDHHPRHWRLQRDVGLWPYDSAQVRWLD